MDPVSMILAFAMQHPDATALAINNYNAPGQVKTERLQQSLADFAMQTVRCYHKSARYRGVQVIGSPWAGQTQYGAQSSVVLRIYLSGLSGQGYEMIVAAMAKQNSYRTFVIDENTLVQYNKNCALEYWTTAGESP